MKSTSKKAFTLIEMLVALALTVVLLFAMGKMVDLLRHTLKQTQKARSTLQNSRLAFNLMAQDFMQIRSRPHIVHESGYDRIDFLSDHTVYGIPRPWIHYFISRKDRTLIRIESNHKIDFTHPNYLGDRQGTYFFADRLGSRCSSLRFHDTYRMLNVLVKCEDVDPVVAAFFKGQPR